MSAQKRSGMKGSLALDLDIKCARCLGTVRSVDGRLMKEVIAGGKTLEVDSEICYLWDMLSASDGCELQ